jgi:hypothetical protein
MQTIYKIEVDLYPIDGKMVNVGKKEHPHQSNCRVCRFESNR